MSNTKSTFQIDQKIVYPSQGVGKIIEITEKKFKNEMIPYYVIYLEVSDMTVLVPITRCEELGIRAIVSPEEAQEALDMIGEEFEPVTTDWKQRYQNNMGLLKSGTVKDIASIVRCLYHRSKIKELPILERKLYDSAKKLLEDEISFALSKSVKEVEALIHAKLEPLGLAKDSKSISSSDDDYDDEESEFMDDMGDEVEEEMDEEDDGDEE